MWLAQVDLLKSRKALLYKPKPPSSEILRESNCADFESQAGRLSRPMGRVLSVRQDGI